MIEQVQMILETLVVLARKDEWLSMNALLTCPCFSDDDKAIIRSIGSTRGCKIENDTMIWVH